NGRCRSMVTPALEVWCCPPYEVRFRLTPHAAPSFTDRTDVRMSVVPLTVTRIEHEFAGRRRNGDDDAMGNGPAGARAGRGEHGGAHQAPADATGESRPRAQRSCDTCQRPRVTCQNPGGTRQHRGLEHRPPAG